jgi:multiple sugar transport system substrate-binding protein
MLGGMASMTGALATPGRGVASPKGHAVDTVRRNDEKTTLTLSLLDAQWEAIEESVEAYAEERGIEIDAKPFAYDELYSELSIALTQQAPTFDVVSLEDPWIPQFASFLVPLEANSELTEAFVPVCESLSHFPADAGACAVPWIGDVQFFGMRSEWLVRAEAALPETWDETVATASEIAAGLQPESDRSAFALSTLTGNDLVRSFLPILQGYGKTLIDEQTSVPQLDTPEALAAIEVFGALAELIPLESSAAGELTNAQRFESGDVAMMSNFWSSNLLESLQVKQTGEAGPIDSVAQPAQPGIPRQTMTGVWLLGIPLGSAVPDEAWMFLQWLAGFETQRRLPERALPPVRVDVYLDEGLGETVPVLPQLLELLESATPRPRSPFYPQLEQLIGGELGLVLSGEKSGAHALKDANVAIREYLVREGVLET